MMRLAQKLDESPVATKSDKSSSTLAVPDIDLKEYLRILWRQKRIILAAVIAVMALAIVIVSSLTPRYTAAILVEINSRNQTETNQKALAFGRCSHFRNNCSL